MIVFFLSDAFILYLCFDFTFELLVIKSGLRDCLYFFDEPKINSNLGTFSCLCAYMFCIFVSAHIYINACTLCVCGGLELTLGIFLDHYFLRQDLPLELEMPVLFMPLGYGDYRPLLCLPN